MPTLMPVLKKINLKQYIKYIDYSKPLEFKKYHCRVLADGYFAFKNWGKGSVIGKGDGTGKDNKLFNFPGISISSLPTYLKKGARVLVVEFNTKASMALREDIITGMQVFYLKGGWRISKYSKKDVLEPEDIMNMTIQVSSRWW